MIQKQGSKHALGKTELFNKFRSGFFNKEKIIYHI